MGDNHKQAGKTGFSKTSKAFVAGVLALVLVTASVAFAERTRLKPGWNIFSPQQDVEVGREVSKDAERQLPMLNDRSVDDYLNRLGLRLAARAPGERYPYRFKGVNDGEINAFALPGGFSYINRGTIEAADNEAQLAGAIGHEIGHVALRHGTNQVTKAYIAQAPLAVLGGAIGSGSIGAVLAQVGAGFGVNSVLLKYSRDAERQADLMGTQILFDSGYNPRAMAEFFEKLQAESKGRLPDFFSSHPNPESRRSNIEAELKKLGEPRGSYVNDSAEFRQIRQYLKSLPSPRKGDAGRERPGEARRSPPPPPSDRAQDFENESLSLRYPDNWRSYGRQGAFTLAPEQGAVGTGGGNVGLAYGVISAIYEPRAHRRGIQPSLEEATDQLIENLNSANPQMLVTRDPKRTRVGGQTAMTVMLVNESPLGGREFDWLVTVLRPEGLFYFVFVAPQGEWRNYQRTFEDIMSSIRFTGR